MTWKTRRSSASTRRMVSSTRGLPASAATAWWKRMFSVPTRTQSPAAAAASADATASRIRSIFAGAAPAALCTAANSKIRRMRYRSRTSSTLSSRTNTPRFSSCTSRPSCPSRRKDSRKVLRETPRAAVSASSDNRVPGASTPSVMRVRSTSATRSAVEPRSSAARSLKWHPSPCGSWNGCDSSVPAGSQPCSACTASSASAARSPPADGIAQSRQRGSDRAATHRQAHLLRTTHASTDNAGCSTGHRRQPCLAVPEDEPAAARRVEGTMPDPDAAFRDSVVPDQRVDNHAGGHHRRSPYRVEPCHPGHHPAAEVSEDDDGGRGGRKDGELTAERHARQRGEHECGYAREPTAFWNDGGHTRRQPARRSALVRAELTQWNGQSVTRRGIRGTPPQIPARSCERSLLRRT